MLPLLSPPPVCSALPALFSVSFAIVIFLWSAVS
jgi:hypothetical protein